MGVHLDGSRGVGVSGLEVIEGPSGRRQRTKAERARIAEPPRKPARNRGHLPPHLPRIERVIEPASPQCPCGCGEMAKIGEDVSERLDVIPAQFRVLVARCLNGGHDRDIPAATSGTDRLPMHPGGRNGDGVMGDEFRVGSGTPCG